MSSILESFRVLSDPIRLRLLFLLEQQELSVAEIQSILQMGQSRISSHLAQLKRAGLVKDRRGGKNIYYGLAEPTPVNESWAAKIRDLVREAVADLPETRRDQTALTLILKKRQDSAREYFDKLAGKFGRSYFPGRSWQSVAHLFLTCMPKLVVADLGAGEGTVSQLLARYVTKVIAVDNSEKMVEIGTQSAREHGFHNLEFRLGDIQDPPIKSGTIDLVLFSQALHHAVTPSKAVASARRILRSGGRIAILDLLAHGVEETRELYADLWLGFSEVELYQLLEDNGFTSVDVQVVSRERVSPHFQTLLATGLKT